MDKVFSKINERSQNKKGLSKNVISAPRNINVNSSNFKCLKIMSSDCQSQKFIDTVVDPFEAVNYPSKFLRTSNPSRLPPHKSYLKFDAPRILLRNLDSPNSVMERK